MGRKVPFRCTVRLRCRDVRDFSDSFPNGVLGNSGHKKSRGCVKPRPSLRRGDSCVLRHAYLVGDDDSVLTLFVFKGCLPSCITKLPSATGHRKHYVLCFYTSHALRVDLSPFSLLREGSGNVAQAPSRFRCSKVGTGGGRVPKWNALRVQERRPLLD